MLEIAPLKCSSKQSCLQERDIRNQGAYCPMGPLEGGFPKVLHRGNIEVRIRDVNSNWDLWGSNACACVAICANSSQKLKISKKVVTHITDLKKKICRISRHPLKPAADRDAVCSRSILWRRRLKPLVYSDDRRLVLPHPPPAVSQVWCISACCNRKFGSAWMLSVQWKTCWCVTRCCRAWRHQTVSIKSCGRSTNGNGGTYSARTSC